MPWPASQEYNEAVQCPDTSFSDAELRSGWVVANPHGIPLPRSGNFADVYEFHCPGGGCWAVKCFTREVAGLRERYAAISRHLEQAQLPFSVDFTFLEQGLRIDGRWYPVLKMRWVDGLTLNEFVGRYADKPAMLEGLLRIWVRMAVRLRGARVVHGDLQHGNVLLVPGSDEKRLAVKLIDYDGMCVPALAARPSGEVGHPCYQHPQRVREKVYGPEVDRFPLLLVATALACLKAAGRSLWEKYNTGDNLLFREADLLAPVKSPLFAELLKIEDWRARKLVGQTIDALRGPLEAVPLLDDVLPELRPADSPRGSGKTAKAPPSAEPVGAESAEADWDALTATAAAQLCEGAARRKRKRGGVRLLGGVAAVALAAGIALGVYLLDIYRPAAGRLPDTSPQAAERSGGPTPPPEEKSDLDKGKKPPTTKPAAPVTPPAEKSKAEPPPKPAVPPAEKIPADASVADLREALKDKDPAVQEVAAARLADHGSAAAPAVVALARVLEDSPHPAVRRNAAIALGKIGKDAKPAVPALVSALRLKESLEVRQQAAVALAFIGLPHTEEALPALLEAIRKDPDPLVRQHCVWSLFQYRQLDGPGQRKLLEAAQPVLTEVLAEKTEALTLVRYDAARMLANWSNRFGTEVSDRTVEVLLEMLGNKSVNVFNGTDVKVQGGGEVTQARANTGGDARYMAARALGWMGSKAAGRKDVAEALKAAAMDPDAKLREAAKEALEVLGVR